MCEFINLGCTKQGASNPLGAIMMTTRTHQTHHDVGAAICDEDDNIVIAKDDGGDCTYLAEAAPVKSRWWCWPSEAYLMDSNVGIMIPSKIASKWLSWLPLILDVLFEIECWIIAVSVCNNIMVVSTVKVYLCRHCRSSSSCAVCTGSCSQHFSALLHYQVPEL